VRKGDNLPTSCAVVTKSGNLNSPEHSGPLRAYKVTALLLPLHSELRVSSMGALPNTSVCCIGNKVGESKVVVSKNI
jgi:hypothetical protein